MRTRAGWVLLAAASVLVAASCRRAPSAAPTESVPVSVDGSASPSTTSPPSQDQLAAAQDAIGKASSTVAVDDGLRPCVVVRLAARPDLLAKAATGVLPQSAEADAIVGLRADCQVASGFASAFASSAGLSGPPLSDSQKGCLVQGYLVLPEQDVRTLSEGGLRPDGDATRRASQEIARRLYEACGLHLPD